MQVYELPDGAFDVLTLCQQEERADDPDTTWFAVDPATMYPAMVQRIISAITGGETAPVELIDLHGNPEIDARQAARSHYRRAAAINPDAWQWAISGLQANATWQDRQQRAEALECARAWFTRALKNRVHGKIGVHLLADDQYKL